MQIYQYKSQFQERACSPLIICFQMFGFGFFPFESVEIIINIFQTENFTFFFNVILSNVNVSQ